MNKEQQAQLKPRHRRYTIKWDASFCFDTEVWFDTDEEAIEYVRQVDGPLRQMFNDKNEMIYDE